MQPGNLRETSNYKGPGTPLDTVCAGVLVPAASVIVCIAEII